LNNVREAISRGDKKTAQQILADILNHDSQNVDAWLLLADIVENPHHRIECLKRVLQINPNNIIAKRRLEEITIQKRTESPSTPVSQPKQEISGHLGIRPTANAGQVAKPNSPQVQNPKNSSSPPGKKKVDWALIIVAGVFLVICFTGAIIAILTGSTNSNYNSQVTSTNAKTTTISADYLMGVMESRGYSFNRSPDYNGLARWLGKSSNGTSMVEIDANGSQITKTSFSMGLPSDDQTVIEENTNDMVAFLNCGSPGWGSTSWLESSMKQLATDNTQVIQTRQGNATIKLWFSDGDVFLFLEIDYG
jgi:hypothetical protein